MANTTFSGPVRSENNFKLVSKNTTTGLFQDRTKSSGVKDTRRYYLEEYFVQLPKLNAVNIIDPDADDASALALYTLANKNFLPCCLVLREFFLFSVKMLISLQMETSGGRVQLY